MKVGEIRKTLTRLLRVSAKPKIGGLVRLPEEKGLEYYVVRNERIPELAIYSFESGERFEPHFLLFARKKGTEGEPVAYQNYVEPKGAHLLKEDAWKEEFLLKIEESGTFAYNYL